MQTLTKDNFNDSIKEGVNVVFFTAPWCGPCSILKSTFPVLEDRVKCGMYMVDASKSMEVFDSNSVQNTPTILIFKNGVEVFRKPTVMRVEDLEKEINRISA